MVEDRWTKLKHLVEKFVNHFPEVAAARGTKVRDLIDDRHMHTLMNLNDAEAADYLRSVDESKVVAAYYILSQRLDRQVLESICRDFMGRTSFRARLLGVSEVGTVLQGTHNKEVSVALARFVRNPHESREFRRCAYGSLKLINLDSTSDILHFLETSLEEPDKESEEFDWDFVDSFLGNN